ncbi:hypothetical protein VP01_772g6 [Puccinia sorghi]|uniref:DDE Tnp4 domain-containing protein n=1 Tax=Puccinia sorghi TaxID=27349 RepID=A0A0L6UBG1_9BASI|nr:hypothetical protein VP01_772g6 [Puccinia sorghi]
MGTPDPTSRHGPVAQAVCPKITGTIYGVHSGDTSSFQTPKSLGALERRPNPSSPAPQIVLYVVGQFHLALRLASRQASARRNWAHVTIGHVFNIGTETADKAAGRFVNAVLKVLKKQAVGYLPLARANQWYEIKESFQLRQGIPNIVGAIDGTHIPIAIPPDDDWKGYINRKSLASIFFQCVVDGQGNFRNVSGGGPGSMHDSRIFRRSRLGQSLIPGSNEGQIIPENSYLVGDAGFNFLQSSTRIVVEQAFGRLKNRFQILLNSQNALPIQAHNNTFACFVLHNLLNRRGSLYIQEWDVRVDQELMFGDPSKA